MPSLADLVFNRILAAVPAAARSRLMGSLRPVELRRDQRLQTYDAASMHAYFPTTAVVSLRYGADGGGSMQVALVGREGVVGTSIFMGDGSAAATAVVQCAGQAYRLAAADLRDACAREPAIHQLMLRYAEALLAQIAQTAACNRRHPLDRQLSRLLLQCQDRTGTPVLALTHERMAALLGVRRSGVTEGALALQRRGVLRYARGRIEVLDRPALLAASCDCYPAGNLAYDRLLGRERERSTPGVEL